MEYALGHEAQNRQWALAELASGFLAAFDEETWRITARMPWEQGEAAVSFWNDLSQSYCGL